VLSVRSQHSHGVPFAELDFYGAAPHIT
jgi:hypothetical protein